MTLFEASRTREKVLGVDDVGRVGFGREKLDDPVRVGRRIVLATVVGRELGELELDAGKQAWKPPPPAVAASRSNVARARFPAPRACFKTKPGLCSTTERSPLASPVAICE